MPVTFKLVNRFSLTCLIREDWDLIWSNLLSDLGELYVIIIAFKQLFEQQPNRRGGEVISALLLYMEEKRETWSPGVLRFWIRRFIGQIQHVHAASCLNTSKSNN